MRRSSTYPKRTTRSIQLSFPTFPSNFILTIHSTNLPEKETSNSASRQKVIRNLAAPWPLLRSDSGHEVKGSGEGRSRISSRNGNHKQACGQLFKLVPDAASRYSRSC